MDGRQSLQSIVQSLFYHNRAAKSSEIFGHLEEEFSCGDAESAEGKTTRSALLRDASLLTNRITDAADSFEITLQLTVYGDRIPEPRTLAMCSLLGLFVVCRR